MLGALLALLLADAAATPGASPAPAPVNHLREVVVDAIRNCPKSHGDEIVVCSRDRGIAEGYRIPRLDPRFAANLRASGRGELASPALAATGTGSCSAVGGGGATGCTLKAANDWGGWKREEKRTGDHVFPW